ncbi:MAG: Lrp/AsnC family transcriptional regulator [Candidatus Auribacter fodinae]|jgi:DNA-binding Lrp family transcriptional regulator|uniref:Lrp/AsnC family transcriptional regulator n=1 Tax=Candidatus Auribacter fodinae TaxID=2093366 RepID=A0A3A4R6K0_9BACT|nr:MAG: Lrp/AsnC family transcriptional regulator [Candidatus Auribacter fodinae]
MDKDNLKKEILDILTKDARKTAADIAVMLNLKEDIVSASIHEMENDKTILNYKAVVNLQQLKSDKTHCIIEVKCSPQRGVGFDAIARRIYKFPEVKSLYLMSGGYDLLLLVEGDTMKDIGFFVAEKLATLDSVHNTSTHFLLKRYKEDGIILETQEKTPRLAVTP